MNTKIPSVLVLGILAFAQPAAGQTPRQLPRQVQPPQPVQAPQIPQLQQPRAVLGGQAQQQNAGELPHNVKLTLEGSFGTIATDFSVTTGGTTVSTDMILESDGPAPTIGTFQAVLTPGEPWQVVVSLGARVPIPVGSNNIQYQDCRLSTTVRIAPGKKVVLWQKGEHKLTLSMEKVEE